MSTALYRRYRPDAFADVIGQEHVTDPLMAAIDSGRINHAYLFSGPRGCGKTTSARIMARCLNCEQGPTSTPCGKCESCVELATGGPGSLDVVEMDAASHGGVDDARELRERAVFAPARDRYKVFIIDEAHMVTPQGFNALLKLVEEPPDHVKFIFATTEPEKVIGTIRSRTHHYPFRLVPPEKLSNYMEHLAGQEGVQIENGVLPLVVRAGGGSVRDSLSVLDQVIAGAVEGTVTYDRSVALLGYTPGNLLDDVVGAIGARDGASLFRVVDHVINSGHSPRRFVEDLLERLRDLIVVLAAGDAAAGLLPDAAPDQLERMRVQARNLGAAGSSRAADLVHEALTSMVGATSPRLQLELLCARLLLRTADPDGGLAVRVEALEQGQVLDGGKAQVAQVSANLSADPAPADTTGSPAGMTKAPQDEPVQTQPQPVEGKAQQVKAQPVEAGPADTALPDPAQARETSPPTAPQDLPGPSSHAPVTQTPVTQTPATQAPAAQAPAPPSPASPAVSAEQQASGQYSAEMVRGRWPEVLDALAKIRRATWALVSQDAQVASLQGDVLTLQFSTSGLMQAFRNGTHAENLAQAIGQVMGLNLRIEAVAGDSTGGDSGGASSPFAPPPRRQPVQADPVQQMQAAQPVQTPPAPSAQATPGQPAQVAPAQPTQAAPAQTSQGTPAQTTSSISAAYAAAFAPPPREGDSVPGPVAQADVEVAPVTAVSPTPAAPAQEQTPTVPPAPVQQEGEDIPPWDDEPPEDPYYEPSPPEAPGPVASAAPIPTAAPTPSHVPSPQSAPTPQPEPGTQSPPVDLPYEERSAATEDEASPDDESVADPHGGLVGQPLIAKILGGVVIDEIVDEG